MSELMGHALPRSAVELLGRALQELRETRGLTPAEAQRRSGLRQRGYLRRIERGVYHPRIYSIMLILGGLGASLSDLDAKMKELGSNEIIDKAA